MGRAPTPPSPATAHCRARHAATVRHQGRDHPNAQETHRDLELQKLAEHVQRVAADWPDIPAHILDRIAGLLCTQHTDEGQKPTKPVPTLADNQKWCPYCRQAKPNIEFGPDGRSRDGLRTRCRHCEALKARQRHQAAARQPEGRAAGP